MLLTLDTNARIGWTLGPRSADTPPEQVAFGSYKLAETTDLGIYLHSADSFFQEMFGRGVTRWAIEQPNTRFAKSAAAAAKMLGLYGHAMYWGALLQIPPPTLFSPAEVKLGLSGNGAADKDMMIAAARALGYEVQNGDEADAVGIRRCYTHGVPETKTERGKKAAAERRAAKAALKGPNLL